MEDNMFKQIKNASIMILAFTLLVACSPVKTPSALPPTKDGNSSYAPQPGDTSLERDSVEIVKTDLTAMTSNPVQYMLTISYFTPTPCHQFRLVVSQTGADKKISLEAYSLRKPEQVCTLMRLATPSQIGVTLGSYPAGHYTVWLNGIQVGEFDA
jgi:hypothetical protein